MAIPPPAPPRASDEALVVDLAVTLMSPVAETIAFGAMRASTLPLTCAVARPPAPAPTPTAPTVELAVAVRTAFVPAVRPPASIVTLAPFTHAPLPTYERLVPSTVARTVIAAIPIPPPAPPEVSPVAVCERPARIVIAPEMSTWRGFAGEVDPKAGPTCAS